LTPSKRHHDGKIYHFSLLHHDLNKGSEKSLCKLSSPDELIRQETIACAETGILMAAWRDHCARSLKAYEDLYVSRLAQENQKYLKVWFLTSGKILFL
jgi:Axonemal dynein light chain